jgi:predicted Zn-dependent peptidase
LISFLVRHLRLTEGCPLEIQTIPHFSEPVHVAVLPNGFTLIHIERKSEFVTAKFVVAGGAKDEKIHGEAHFLEHLIAGGRHRGGAHPRKKVFADQCGLKNSNASTSQISTSYYGRVWQKHAKEFIEILGEMISQPELHDAAVAAEVGVIESEIRRNLDKAHQRIKFLRNIYPSRLDICRDTAGTIESIREITAESLKVFHQRVYTTSRCALVTSGTLDLHEIALWISPFLEHIEVGCSTDMFCQVSNGPEVFGVRTISEKLARSYEVDLVNRGPQPGEETVLAYIKNQFFESYQFGKLVNELRHERGLVYSLSIQSYKWPMLASGINIDGISQDRVDEVLECTQSIMNGADLETFDVNHLEWIKRDVIMHETDNLEGFVSVDGMIDLWMLGRIRTHNPKQIMQTVEHLTPRDILEVHRKYWDPDHMLVIRTEPA